MTPKVIDLSSDNGNVNMSEIATAGVKTVILRTSLGYGQTDKDLIQNAKNASAAGLSVGFYHLAYTHPNVAPIDDGVRQGNFFVQSYQATGITPTMLAIDLETATTLSPADYEAFVAAFLQTVKESTGIDVMVYSYKSWLDSHLSPSHNLGSSNLWLANYDNVSSPALPNGWAEWYLWQYSETGVVGGVSTHVDCSMFNS